ncbi:MAG TPA: hypothetical protein VGB85_17725 [Nannocystis sp.]
MPRPHLLLALLLGACGDAASATSATNSTTTTGITGASQPTSDPSTSTGEATPTTGTAGSATGSTSTGDGSDGPKLDLGMPDFGGRDTDGGCVAVDLLFVIDNSPSMGPYQEALGAAFPMFVDEMFAALPPGTDLHVGITTTSFYSGNCSESTNNCKSTSSEAEILEHYTPPTDGDNGENGGQGRLFDWEDMRFFAADTAGDPGPLKTWFTGAATAAGEVGCSFEMAAAGAGWSADPANAGSNAGFLRDEGAVLLVFVLSDEPDKSPEPVSQWVDKLVAAKQGCGGLQCILAAGLVSDFCHDNAADTTLKTFLESFSEPPIIGSIGSVFPNDPPPDYTGVVGSALAQVIGQKCDELQPPG